MTYYPTTLILQLAFLVGSFHFLLPAFYTVASGVYKDQIAHSLKSAEAYKHLGELRACFFWKL